MNKAISIAGERTTTVSSAMARGSWGGQPFATVVSVCGAVLPGPKNCTEPPDGGVQDSGADQDALPPNVLEIAPRQAQPIAIAVDDQSVYWTNFGDGDPQDQSAGIFKAPKEGGPTEELTSKRNRPMEIALDANSVCWTEQGVGVSDGRLLRVAKSGGNPAVIADVRTQPIGIAVYLGTLYWIDFDAAGGVRSAPTSGNPVTQVSSGWNYPYGVAVDASGIYYPHWGDLSLSVVRTDLDGSHELVLTGGAGSPTRLALTADRVYFGTSDMMNDLRNVPKVGGAMTSLPSIEGQKLGVAADDMMVYWSSGKGSPIRGLFHAAATLPGQGEAVLVLESPSPG